MANYNDKKIGADEIAAIIGVVYLTANKEVESILQESVASRQLADVNYYRQQRAKILKIVSDLQSGTSPIVAQAVQSGYKEGGRRASNWIKSFVGSKQTNFTKADQQAVETLVALTLSRLESANSAIVKRAEDILRAAAIQNIEAINVSGPRFEAAAEAFEDALDRAGVTFANFIDEDGTLGAKLIEINGRNYNASKYAQLVVRTESRNAHTLATLQKLKENGIDKVQVTSHDTDCDICSEYDGNVYSISGETPGLDVLDEYPPFHPNCQHLIGGAL